MLRIVVPSVLVSILAFAASVQAQQPPQAGLSSEEEQARMLFQAGRTAYEGGRFEAALRHFQESYELSHRPALLFNIGSAADRLQMNERALESYRAYLEAVPNADNRELTEARIRFLEGVIERGGDRNVPTPEEAARTVGSDTGSQRDRPPPSGDVTSEWWFWTLIAVLAVGAIVGIAAGITVAASGVQAPLDGDVPTFMALGER
jgi:tetratricopeptide (TPR) repeat protein